MKQTKTSYLLSTLLLTYGVFTALAALLLQYPKYYTTVLVPSPFKHGYLPMMMLISCTVFSLIIAVSLLIRRRIRGNPRLAWLPGALFGCAVGLLPIMTPAWVSDFIGGKVHWLTPTIVNNSMWFAFALFIVAMGLGGVVVSLLLFRHNMTGKQTTAAMTLYPVTILLSGVTAGALGMVATAVSYDRMFFLTGGICVLCAILSLLLGWRNPEKV